ncbi:PucR family transcriptional regulator [Mumia sp. DW29H23]|uniref:PucR family transcriptional regulator n=1 Tax=Mumia sp. DW29H23 TaxID=3421241 RepID=UPI003D68EADF
MPERSHRSADRERRMRLVESTARSSDAVHGSISTFTIADFLAMGITLDGEPVVVAGEEHLHRRIRWLHVTELVDTHGLLQGGELILATGVGLADSPDEGVRYVDALADEGVAGLVIELGRRFSSVPPEMVRACRRRGLPLIALRREVPFVKMTEAAHSIILMGQRRLLQTTAMAHQRFTELGAADASVDQLVTAAGELAEGQIVFSNLMYQVLAVHTTDGVADDLLRRWSRKAFTLTQSFGTRVDETDRCVVVPVEARGQQRGRLVLFTAGAPDPAQVIVLERAASALAMRLLLEDDDVVVANAQRTVLADLVSGRCGRAESIHARTAALGHPTRHRHYLPIIVAPDQERDLGPVLSRALDDAQVDALVGRLTPERWGVLLLLKRAEAGPADVFAAHVAQVCEDAGIAAPTLGRGTMVSDLAEVARSFAEASDVASAARATRPAGDRRPLYSIDDIRLRGLLYTLRHDARLQAFVERTLGPLQLRDALDGGDWVRTLAVYLRVRSNKSLAAQELGISRPTLYERLARIQRLLGVDLDDPETTTSLYAAIMVVESAAGDASLPSVLSGPLALQAQAGA